MRLGNLKALRIGRKLTQKDVADYLTMTPGAFNLIENGKREADNYTLLKLAEFFNTTTDYILGNTRDPRSISEIKNLPGHVSDCYSEIDVIYDELVKINGDDKPVTKAQINALLVFIKNFPDLFIGLGNKNDGE